MIRIRSPRPRMSTPRKRRIGTRNAPPLITTDVINIQIIEELRKRPIEVLPTKQKQNIAVMRRSHERGSTPRPRRRLAHHLCDLEELLLLAAILLKDLVQIDIFGVAAFDLGGFGLCFLLTFTGLLGGFLGLRATSVECFDGGVVFFFWGC